MEEALEPNFFAKTVAAAMVGEKALWTPEDLAIGERSEYGELKPGDRWVTANILVTNPEERAIADEVVAALGKDKIRLMKITAARPNIKKPSTLPEAMAEVELEEGVVKDFKTGNVGSIMARAQGISAQMNITMYDVMQIAVSEKHLEKVRSELKGSGRSKAAPNDTDPKE